MLAFSVLTPYYNEEVIYSKQQLKEENEDGVTILFYLQRIFPGTARNHRNWRSAYISLLII